MTNANHSNDGERSLQDVLAADRRGHASRRWLWIAAAVLVLAAAALFFWRRDSRTSAYRFETQPVTRGTLVVKVSATGNLQPTNQVDVGSELSGIVEKVFVDENDRVKKGQVLARLDLSKLQDAVAHSRASLKAAQAQVLQAKATVTEARALLERQREVSRLSGGKVPSKSEMESAEANAVRAEANVASADAGVAQARAALESDLTNLEKASIRSSINGVVLTRKVEPGQTVAASFQVATLFTIAEDLTKMELKVNIDEADVGRVAKGQTAVFSVDAWPGRRYTAEVTRVGFGSEEKDGVISYPAVLRVQNDDLSLRPGMTGTAEITTLTHENALVVPTAALRFTPPATNATEKTQGRGAIGLLMPRAPRTAAKKGTPSGQPKVWVLRGGVPEPVAVTPVASNGRQTEIEAGPLAEGADVITEAVSLTP